MQELPKSVVERLKAAGTSASVHPDADVINAFMERSLPERERAHLITHLATCDECREIIVRATPQVEIARPTEPRKRWLGTRSLQWAAAMCTVLVAGGVLLLRDQPGKQELGQQTRVAVAEPSRATVTPAPARAETANTRDTSTQIAALSPAPEERTDRARAKKAETPAARAFAGISPAQPEAQTTASAALRKSAAASKASTSELAELKAPTAPPQIPSETAKNADAGVQTDTISSDSPEIALSKAKPPQPAPAAAPSSNVRASGMLVRNNIPATAAQMASRPMGFQLGNSPTQWMVSNGTVQRSIDAGRTWQTASPVSGVSFRTVAAVGSHVWAGGAAGALYHSTDGGQHWAAIHPATNGASLTADITGIQFADAQHVTVTAAAEQWSTSDGGQTWQKQ